MQDLLPDLYDHYADELTLLSLCLNQYGKRKIFWGEIITVKCFEDNSKVKQVLTTSGKGKVLFVDGGGSLNRALLGDMIAMDAVNNGWEGIVINGCVRDVGVLSQLDIGIKALGANPIKTVKRDAGEINPKLAIADIIIVPGMMLYSDENGVAISSKQLDLLNML
ncbi:putative 4-hydroxy-4-methyl-2-oxoglutarate aldolase [Shewanella sp. D64]|uniref:putative 4-hydroxy-4-methyl-2-oxoglutarate aldolase n=1 Tax=unclassified Shewanella TaxID=196818 RepID=UPI0022BA17ED|nr:MULTISPECIES: putative 4-hydroxy-4-methyl-2-oxoglutarate aldolase [unclassified Shewanella]MEC4725311.1 putative 4-hydroxy-4-methyl-2-oxoglutarate aldolase [Shewanella sp. D64]MEC4735843.1 putative 4-hydroxy-4-methyl-2-oxoglutarate aldolase [Shewanella sp. E94]WBJ93186.1 putative 4-hydroxy-4-methyl-2-oxoglutarate aldolase [Shewanella sp. MTB7]